MDIKSIIDECNRSCDREYVKQVAKEIVLTTPYNVCDFAEYVELADDPEIMPILEKGIISFGDIVHIYEFMFLMVDCQKKYFNLPSFESLIRNSKNPKLMLYCLAFVPGINQTAMLNSLYATKSIKYIEKLKDEEFGLQDLIDEEEYQRNLEIAKNTDYFPEILRPYSNKGTNLLQSVINTKNPYLMNEMADYLEYLRDYRGIDNVDDFLEILGYAIARLPEPLHHYEFAASTIYCDRPLFERRVKESGDIKYIYYLYEYVHGVNKEELKRIISASNSIKYKEKIGIPMAYPKY